MKFIKQAFKRNTRNLFFKAFDGLGRSFNKLYENRNHDIHSNGEAWLLKKIGTHNPTIIFDVGANIGEYASLVSEYCPTADIYSFEPVQSTYEILCKATEKHPQVKTFKNGFYKKKSTQTINLYDSNAHSSLFDVTGENSTSDRRETINLVAGR
ncbi:MAG: FkbM family methyltransferase [Cyclobacteriaceae bacterium]